jgi:phage-related protein
LIVCTHGILKKKQKTPKEAINRADKMKREYEEAKKSGEIKHVEPKTSGARSESI